MMCFVHGVGVFLLCRFVGFRFFSWLQGAVALGVLTFGVGGLF